MVICKVWAASSFGMLHTLDRCSALIPFDLPAETAAIVAKAVASMLLKFASNKSHAESSIDTLPKAIDA